MKYHKAIAGGLVSIVAVLSVSAASMFIEKNHKLLEKIQLNYYKYEGAYFDKSVYNLPYLNTKLFKRGNKVELYVDFNNKQLPVLVRNKHLIIGSSEYVLDGLEKRTISSYVMKNFDSFDDDFKRSFVLKYSYSILNELNKSIRSQFDEYKNKLIDLINKNEKDAP